MWCRRSNEFVYVPGPRGRARASVGLLDIGRLSHAPFLIKKWSRYPSGRQAMSYSNSRIVIILSIVESTHVLGNSSLSLPIR